LTTLRERTIQHGVNLLALFPQARIQVPFDLVQALRKIERKAHRSALRRCNDPHYSEEQQERDREAIEQALDAILGPHSVPLIINRDPRGHALKIADSYMKDKPGALHTDWGGYGILSPEHLDD
jgi:hypothetical protein